jgi:hypothetical protein
VRIVLTTPSDFEKDMAGKFVLKKISVVSVSSVAKISFNFLCGEISRWFLVFNLC